MNIEPLQGSAIKLDRDMHCITYSWVNGKKSLLQYPAALFMLFWLGGWAVGEYMAAKELFTGDKMPLFGKLFLGFWLCAWTVGGAAVACGLYSFLRPPKPAKLTLSAGAIEYQTGTSPENVFNRSTYNQTGEKPNLFKFFRNKIYKLDMSEVKNLRLEYAGERQRLTCDKGIERIEIGPTLTEPEREWLYGILNNHLSK